MAFSKYFSSDPQRASLDLDNLMSYKNDLCLVSSIMTIFCCFSTIPNHVLLRWSLRSQARRSFGEEVLALKLRCCKEQPSTFPMLTISPPAISRALLQMTSKAYKLPLETKPVARDKNTCWTFKPGQQTFIAHYSTDYRSNNHNDKLETKLAVALFQ